MSRDRMDRMDHSAEDGEHGVEPESDLESASESESDEALRSRLHARADLVTITTPPISAVRRRARQRRRRRGMAQALSGVVAACAVVAGIVAWSPGRDDAGGPAPASTVASSPSFPGTAPGATRPTAPSPSPPTTSRSASISDFLLASDLGAGWVPGSDGMPMVMDEVEMTSAEDACDNGAVRQGALEPALSSASTQVENSPPGKATNSVMETVYNFRAGGGATAMQEIRAALETGCGAPQTTKLLASPQTVADEVLAYTFGDHRGVVFVRSGDLVAATGVAVVPSGQEGVAWIQALAKDVAVRLTTG